MLDSKHPLVTFLTKGSDRELGIGRICHGGVPCSCSIQLSIMCQSVEVLGSESAYNPLPNRILAIVKICLASRLHLRRYCSDAGVIFYSRIAVIRCSHWSLFANLFVSICHSQAVCVASFGCIAFLICGHHFKDSRLCDWLLLLLMNRALSRGCASDSLKIIVCCLVGCLRVVSLMLLQPHHVVVWRGRASRDRARLFCYWRHDLFTVVCLLSHAVQNFLLVLLLSNCTAVLFGDWFQTLLILMLCGQIQVFGQRR